MPTHGYEPTREAAMAAFRPELAKGVATVLTPADQPAPGRILRRSGGGQPAKTRRGRPGVLAHSRRPRDVSLQSGSPQTGKNRLFVTAITAGGEPCPY